jgi:hypothetical protein
VLYSGGLHGFFVQDDFGWLESSRFHSLGEYAACFFRFNPALTYRPLSQETFFCLGQRVFGLWPMGFHLVSLSLHLLGSTLVYLLLRSFTSPLPSAAGALFYATHGALAWAVYWISALPEPLALVFFLGAVLLFIRFDRTGDRRAWAASLAAMLLGIASKESILSVPLVLAAYCVLYARKRLLWTAPFVAVSAVYTIVRLTSRVVAAAPYPLTFGRGTGRNLVHYLAWTTGFSDTFIVHKLHWDVERALPVLAAAFALSAVLLWALARARRTALFAALWLVAALQPVLYFSEHIFPYYLAPALPAAALLLAAGLEGLARPACRIGTALALTAVFLWAATGSVRREGRWWNERSFHARDFLRQMRALDPAIPDDRTVFIAGMEPDERGVLQDDAAFKAYGFSTRKYILLGLDERTPGQIRHLHATGELRGFDLWTVHGWKLEEWSEEFRRDPEPFLLLAQGWLDRPDVRVELEPAVVHAERDTLTLRVFNFPVESIDVLYTIDGEFRPPLRGWRLERDYTSTVAVGSETPRGTYYYLAIRDSSAAGPKSWISTAAHVEVR